MKPTLLLLSIVVLTFVVPMRSKAQSGDCWNVQLVNTVCDNCSSEVQYSKLVCLAQQRQGGTSCNIAAYSYPCEVGSGAGACYGVIFSAEIFGTCGGASPAPAGLSGEHPLAARHLIIFIPNSHGGYQEASLTVPGGPSPKTRFASQPRITYIPNSGGGYQDASFVVFSCPSARGLRQ